METTGAIPSDMNSAKIMAETLSAIIGEPAENIELSDMSVDVTQKATNSLEVSTLSDNN